MDDDNVTGRRVRRARDDLGLTQEQLAERAEVSVGVIKKIERGGTCRVDTYHAVARALGVQTSFLFEPLHVGADVHAGDRTIALMPLRQVISPPVGITGLPELGDIGEEVQLEPLRETLRTIAQLYQRDDYRALGAALPGAVAAAQQAVRWFDSGPAHRAALAVRATALLEAGKYLTQVRAYDLGHTALAAAVRDALAAEDQLMAAAGVYLQGWTLLRQSRFDEAERLSIATADAIEPRLSRATRAELGLWGRLLLRASTSAARNNKDSEARDLLRLSRAAATALGSATAIDWHSYGRFDWSSVALMGIENHMIARRYDRVLALSERLPKDIPLTSDNRHRHMLDVSLAEARGRSTDRAFHVLGRLRASTPEWLRHQSLARDVYRAARKRRRAPLNGEQRELGEFLSVQ
ncbi:helix-turn-helix domain-containing protein [Streptomyces radicis]|uniref:XRE family transcriptional regulator n=1 Tax=Streptomyces radicis TaxID=1750517 RepID=A0A3A9W406_9ACTN|nr:helix-turn-helix transcriptional regulator [Streptomyces radicis]RKN07908.1 XRE family transcriptional regulator [Streptomyces radicis]RKN20638.1 XRE family transcriptional regulator [Streptomyces radicis]